jgi:hypothetical protein
MRSRFALCLALAGLIAAGGCRQLEPWQEADLDNVKSAGLPEFHPKDPVLAGGLNLVIGIGDAYNGEWGGFVINLLLWPASILWGVPEAAITATNINRQSTWAYYYHGPGKPQLDAALAKQKPAAPSIGP